MGGTADASLCTRSWTISGAYEAEMLRRLLSRTCLAIALLGAMGVATPAPRYFEIITGKPSISAVSRDFYLERPAIPVEKRNAVLVKTPEGRKALFALIATADFGSQLQRKYFGMLILEGHLAICGKNVGIGSYGFGIRRRRSLEQQTELLLYNRADEQMIACSMERDLGMREPKPLQIMIEPSDSARLYLGRDWVRHGP